VPIHAAGIYDGPAEHQECCSDYIVSSYTPTLTALKKARDGQASRLRRDMTMLTVAESHAPGLPVLVNAVAEVEEVQRISRTASVTLVSSSQPVAGSSATTTVQSLKESLPLAHIVHLACHGIQKEQDPLLSGFCLGDGKLTVADLMRLKLPRAYLAFLSACETAKGDRDQPDQMVHLAAAMLFCGFRSVIGTMWCVAQLHVCFNHSLKCNTGRWVTRMARKWPRRYTRRCSPRRFWSRRLSRTRLMRPCRSCASRESRRCAGQPSFI
jgi:CHAT domain-containing protein